jgi:orotidine-5'-phosphate decarboxylase
VIGRAVTKAEDPVAAMRSINDEMGSVRP